MKGIPTSQVTSPARIGKAYMYQATPSQTITKKGRNGTLVQSYQESIFFVSSSGRQNHGGIVGEDGLERVQGQAALTGRRVGAYGRDEYSYLLILSDPFGRKEFNQIIESFKARAHADKSN